MNFKSQCLWLAGIVMFVLVPGFLRAQEIVPSVDLPPSSVLPMDSEGLLEPALLEPQQERGAEPSFAPTPARAVPLEVEEVAPQSSKTDQIIADAARRFGAFVPINNVTLPPQSSSMAMPPMFAVSDRQQDDVHYLSPPVVRPWENTVLRPYGQFCHQPLYFEEVNLERYGVRWPVVQPICSAAHFFGSIAILPYKWTLDRPMRCYHYPHPYLPGTNGFESRRSLRLAPAMVQASVVTGLFLVAP